MLYITSGQSWTDIDAFACAVAYSHLLREKGIENKIYLPGVLNSSITNSILELGIDFEKQISITKEDKFIVVDVSEPEQIANGVNENNIIEIFDHRYGFVDHWKNVLNEKSKIEMVGACATLIWEEYKKENIEIDFLNANLLILAIVSNTLDLKSSVSTDRDLLAFEELQEFIDLPTNWKENYFNEQTKSIEENPVKAIVEDTKGIVSDITFAQIELWSGESFIEKNQKEIKETLENIGNKNWMISVPSISEGINYIYTESAYLKDLLSKVIEINFDGDIGKTTKLWLRKEIRTKILKLNML